MYSTKLRRKFWLGAHLSKIRDSISNLMENTHQRFSMERKISNCVADFSNEWSII